METVFNKKDCIKLTMIGDLMLHYTQVKPAEFSGYDAIFSEVFDAFSASDALIANLETPLGKKIVSKDFSFCAPKDYAVAVKKLHPKLVLLTANNHSLDRGIKGLESTIRILDKLEIKHTGTRVKGSRGLVIKVKGIKIGIINYTYGTNLHRNHYLLEGDDLRKINLMQQQVRKIPWLRKHEFTETLCNIYREFLKKHGLHLTIPADVRYIFGYMKQISKLKKRCDYLIAFPHVGAQYGDAPSKYTKTTVRRMLNAGADFVCANHEHVIHPFAYRRRKICGIYSLGNFVGTAGMINPPFDRDADISAAVHIYIDKKTFEPHFSFSLFKSVLDDNRLCRVVPFYKLVTESPDDIKLRARYLSAASKLTGKKESKVRREYFMEN